MTFYFNVGGGGGGVGSGFSHLNANTLMSFEPYKQHYIK